MPKFSKLRPLWAEKKRICGRRKGGKLELNNGAKSLATIIFPNFFYTIFCSIRIYISFGSKSSSVSQLDIEWQKKLLVLKHMEDPVYILLYSIVFTFWFCVRIQIKHRKHFIQLKVCSDCFSPYKMLSLI